MARASEVVVARETRSVGSVLRLLNLVLIDLLEQALLLPLVVTHIEGVACCVLALEHADGLRPGGGVVVGVLLVLAACLEMGLEVRVRISLGMVSKWFSFVVRSLAYLLS